MLEEQPRCFLETVSLDDNLRFEALSYAWGNPNIKRPIKRENREWPVTNNLEAGLRYLRSPSEEKTLWIDALCINQESIEERNSQILLLKSICSTAAKSRSGSVNPSVKAMKLLPFSKNLAVENTLKTLDSLIRSWAMTM